MLTIAGKVTYSGVYAVNGFATIHRTFGVLYVMNPTNSLFYSLSSFQRPTPRNCLRGSLDESVAEARRRRGMLLIQNGM